MIILPNKKIHIVSFDIPYPANYGGVIDVFYKLKSLHELGWKIHLHCFMYGRKKAPALVEYCERVTYYPRDISKSKLFLKLPYIVSSRNNKHLLDVLLENKDPILFEGLHTTFPLHDKRLKGRKIIVRTHNIEHEYYRHLGLAESNLFKRYYFNSEATKLESYEPILNLTSSIAAISQTETTYFHKKFGKKAFYLPAFHPYENVTNKDKLGEYVLYHANLSVAENHKAAMYLVREIFNDLKINFIIAGNHPNTELKAAIKARKNIQLIENPSTEKMENLISDAQINILPAFQATGIKLKLLAALFIGRHVIVNSMMLEGTGLESLCVIANDAQTFKENTIRLFKIPLSIEDKTKRKILLEDEFSNIKNAKNLAKHLTSN